MANARLKKYKVLHLTVPEGLPREVVEAPPSGQSGFLGKLRSRRSADPISPIHALWGSDQFQKLIEFDHSQNSVMKVNEVINCPQEFHN